MINYWESMTATGIINGYCFHSFISFNLNVAQQWDECVIDSDNLIYLYKRLIQYKIIIALLFISLTHKVGSKYCLKCCETYNVSSSIWMKWTMKTVSRGGILYQLPGILAEHQILCPIIYLAQFQFSLQDTLALYLHWCPFSNC